MTTIAHASARTTPRAAAPAGNRGMKIISSNLKRGMSWEATARDLKRLLSTKPDAIGFQEFYNGDLGRLKGFLAKHGYGVNLETDVPVAYNKKRFKLVAEGSRQFTPRTSWNPPRFGNWVALRDRESGEVNVVTNTHLTQTIRIPRNKRFHEEQVRELADLQRDLRRRFGDKANFFLTGDMNTAKLKNLAPLMKGTGLKPVRVPGASHIDWIFAETRARRKQGIKTGSDHDSILAVFRKLKLGKGLTVAERNRIWDLRRRLAKSGITAEEQQRIDALRRRLKHNAVTPQTDPKPDV